MYKLSDDVNDCWWLWSWEPIATIDYTIPCWYWLSVGSICCCCWCWDKVNLSYYWCHCIIIVCCCWIRVSPVVVRCADTFTKTTTTTATNQKNDDYDRNSERTTTTNWRITTTTATTTKTLCIAPLECSEYKDNKEGKRRMMWHYHALTRKGCWLWCFCTASLSLLASFSRCRS